MDVSVLGAQSPGQWIAEVSVLGGNTVTLHDVDVGAAMDGVDLIERRLDDAVDAGNLSPGERATALEQLEPTTGLEGAVAGSDLVIDAVTDDASALQQRFADVEEFVDRETLIATGRPSLSVTAAAAGLKHPDRALGINFHRPPETPLVELVLAEQTTQSTAERAQAFVDTLDRESIIVADAPGMATTRLSLALEVEAMRMVENGIAGVEAVDTTLVQGFDYPIGPLEQADRAGLESRLDLLEQLDANVGPRYKPPDLLRELVRAGKTGADAGVGFYVWEDGEPVEPSLGGPAIQERSEPRNDPSLEKR